MDNNTKKIIISASSFSIGVLCGFTICGYKLVKSIHSNKYVRHGIKSGFQQYISDILYGEKTIEDRYKEAKDRKKNNVSYYAFYDNSYQN